MLADSDDDDDDDDFSTDGDSLCEVPSGNNFSKDDDTKVWISMDAIPWKY